MATFTLDDIAAAAERQYGDLTIPDVAGEDVVLVNVLRLPKEKRNALKALQKKADQDPAEAHEDFDSPDEGDVLRESVRLVARSEADAERLLSVIGDDLTRLAVVFQMYTGETELGEASASQN